MENIINFLKKIWKVNQQKIQPSCSKWNSRSTSSLEKAININKNDAVITPNFSCSANINCISQCDAKAIVVESEKDTLGLDFELVKKAILKFKPKALQLVHVYGFPARDTIKIIKLCKKKNVIVIEDASEALGAKINGKKWLVALEIFLYFH